MRLLIVPGHGGDDKGTASPDGRLVESAYTLEIGKRLFDLIDALSPKGITWGISRLSDDTKHRVRDRAAIAEKWEADVVLELHVDAAPGSSRGGLTAYHYPYNEYTRAVGGAIMRTAPHELYRHHGTPRSAHSMDWPRVHNVLGKYKADAVLVEMGFASNKIDVDALMDENVKERLVAGLYAGILGARDLRDLHYSGTPAMT